MIGKKTPGYVEAIPERCRKCAVFKNMDAETNAIEDAIVGLTDSAMDRLDNGDFGSLVIARAALADLRLQNLSSLSEELLDLGMSECPGSGNNSRSISIFNTPRICRNPAFEQIMEDSEVLKSYNITHKIWSGDM